MSILNVKDGYEVGTIDSSFDTKDLPVYPALLRSKNIDANVRVQLYGSSSKPGQIVTLNLIAGVWDATQVRKVFYTGNINVSGARVQLFEDRPTYDVPG